jgi:gamma-glutamyl phosphate reductase
MRGQILQLATFVELEADADANGAVLIDGRVGTIYSCNSTAAVLVSEMAKGVELEKLNEVLARQFDVSPDRAIRDTRQFIDALNSAGLLELIEPLVAQDS